MPPRDASADASARAVRLAAAGVVGASLAHELRNALATAESSLYLARRDVGDRERLVPHLDKVAAEIRRAHDVVGAVLGLARGEPPRREPVRLSALVAAARGTVVLPTNVTFSVSIEPPDLVARGDAVLLERVLSNLYSNAAEALSTRGRGAIVTRAWREPPGVLLTVDDDGPGVAPDAREAVFDPLVTTKASGTGLGLALCRVVVEAHGGRIAAELAPSGGARFRVALPG